MNSGTTFTPFPFRRTKSMPPRKRKIYKILGKINKRIGEERLKVAEKRGFKVGCKFYYYSKYGGRQKHILKDIRQDGQDVKLYGENHNYELEYCFTEVEIRDKKFTRILGLEQ